MRLLPLTFTSPTPGHRFAGLLFFLWVNSGEAFSLPNHRTRLARLPFPMRKAPITPASARTTAASAALALLGIFLITLLSPKPADAQRLNFGQFAGEGITILPVAGSGTLDFNEKQKAIVPGDLVTISLQDDMADIMAVFEITGPIGFDLDIVVTENTPGKLELDDDHASAEDFIPFTLGWAFSNSGHDNVADALVDARANVIPVGLRFATFPVIRRAINNGPPGPPPRPLDGNTNTRPTETAYLFFFGSINVPPNARVGTYTSQIDIHVSYNAGDEL